VESGDEVKVSGSMVHMLEASKHFLVLTMVFFGNFVSPDQQQFSWAEDCVDILALDGSISLQSSGFQTYRTSQNGNNLAISTFADT